MADSRARHAEHDLELVAAYAAGEATGAELDRAERQLDACDLCVGVARELRSITLALQALPSVAEMGALPPAPRDFRLTPEQAARLRPSAPRARWADRLVAAVAAFGRPVGVSLAALGLVGLLVGGAALGPLAGSSRSSSTATDAYATAAPAGAGAANPAGAEPAMKESAEPPAYGPASTPAARQTGGGLPQTDDAAAASVNPATWLLVASLVALVGGLALVLVATRRG